MKCRLPAACLILVAAFAGGGCKSMRRGSDAGHRIIDQNGAWPDKLFGMVGAAAGYTAGLPVAVLLLPTYPFENLSYQAGPEHDLPMPILMAPVEIGGGLGALILGGPFELMMRGMKEGGMEEDGGLAGGSMSPAPEAR